VTPASGRVSADDLVRLELGQREGEGSARPLSDPLTRLELTEGSFGHGGETKGEAGVRSRLRVLAAVATVRRAQLDRSYPRVVEIALDGLPVVRLKNLLPLLAVVDVVARW
jgi:hypothetical protein